MPYRSHPGLKEHSVLMADTYIALSKDKEIWQGSLTHGLRRITRACANAIGVQRASVWLLKPDFSELDCITRYLEDRDCYEQGAKLSALNYPRYFAALSNNRVIDASDAFSDPRTREFSEGYLKLYDIHAMLESSIRTEGRLRGMLCLESVGATRLWSRAEQTFAASVADLISQLLLMNDLRNSELRYRALFEGSSDAILLMHKGLFIDCNSTAVSMFGLPPDQILEHSPLKLSPPIQPDGMSSNDKAQMKIRAALGGHPQWFEWQHLHANRGPFDAEVTLNAIEIDGNTHLMCSVRDISTRKQMEAALEQSRKQLEYRANHDTLTGLPNRECLHERTSSLLARCRADNKRAAIFLMDLDRFKEVNDTLGHRIGDQLLREIGMNLRPLLTQRHAEPYRLGGDEFAVVAAHIKDAEQALALATIINQQLRQPIIIEGMRLELGASIGIALYPQHGHNSHALLRCADVAMYHAKTHGTSAVVYDAEFDSHSRRRLTMGAELGIAIRENQLRLHFQPRISLQDGRCTGCEALLRWEHPEHGLVPPGDFIPVAEMSDVIHPLSAWVVANALAHIRQWRAKGIQLPVAINLSARNLTDPRCPERIAALLQEYQVPHHLLEIEITESALISDPKQALKVVDQLHALGLNLAIDDFGTGYSSLSYLKRLPISTLKVDRSFVKDMLSNEGDAVIVRSTIGLAHSFGMNVVAEGVEDDETLHALKELQCDQAQGYYIAKPLPADQFLDWLAALSRN